jgi:hypothetical protein
VGGPSEWQSRSARAAARAGAAREALMQATAGAEQLGCGSWRRRRGAGAQRVSAGEWRRAAGAGAAQGGASRGGSARRRRAAAPEWTRRQVLALAGGGVRDACEHGRCGIRAEASSLE